MLSAQPLSRGNELPRAGCFFSHCDKTWQKQLGEERFIWAHSLKITVPEDHSSEDDSLEDHSSEDHSPLRQGRQSGVAPSMLVGAGGFCSYVTADQDGIQTRDKYNLQDPPPVTHFL